MTRLLMRLAPLLRRLARESDANVMILTALAALPTLFGLGFSIDYARAMMLQARINAVADAASLAGTDTIYLLKDVPTTTAAATQIFTAQVAEYQDFTYTPSTDLKVTVTNQGALNLGRTVLVQWRGQSTNLFSGVLGVASLTISGASTAYATQAPNVNFFLVMDKSPSMLLPSTSAGIAAIQKVTGCAFACHAQFPRNDNIKVRDGSSRDVFLDANYYSSGVTGYNVYYLIDATNKILYNSAGTKIGTAPSVSGTTLSYKNLSNANATITGYYADGYWLTHNYAKIYSDLSSIPLRVGAETLAAQDLIPFAQTKASQNGVTYKLQFFSFDWTHTTGGSPVTQFGSMTDVNSLTSAAVPDLDGTQDWWYANNSPTSSKNINDMATEFNNMLTSLNAVMPTPGTGASTTSPQEVMLLVTDGVVDESIGGSRRNRELSSTDLASCTTIKNRGIKIAILYTEYLPAVLNGDSWSQTNVVPYLPNVLPALQSCASAARDGTPLVYTVSSDQSISTALSALFALTIQNSHLIS